MAKIGNEFEHVAIGAMLRAQREKQDLTLKDIASAVGYRNLNFISMIESGRSNIPTSKIQKLINAYQFPKEIGLAIIQRLHPDIWDLFTDLVVDNQAILKGATAKSFGNSIDKVFNKTIKELNLEHLLAVKKA